MKAIVNRDNRCEIERYFSIIVECEKTGKCFKKKTHYQAIIDMANEDRRI